VSTTANTAAEAAAAEAAVWKKYKAKVCLVTGAILGMVTMNTNMNPILVIVTLQLQHFTVTLGVGYPRFLRIQGDVLPCIFTVCGPFCLVNRQSQ
jgi:hypothetical protein